MAATHHKKLLLLTLVHPDFLPPVYASAQVLRDEGYTVHILTFDSYVPAEIDLGKGIIVETVGKHHGIGLRQRLQIRKKYTARAGKLAAEGNAAIIAYCAFTLLCALKIKRQTPLIYYAMEIADFIWSSVKRSPLSQLNNLLALKQVHKADLVATPSPQRSAWLAKRANLKSVPYAVLNTAYTPHTTEPNTLATYKAIVPQNLWDKKTILYTGAVNAHLCIMELVQAFCAVNDPDSALLITGIKDNRYCNEIKAFVAASNCAERIKLFPYITREEMLALQANANIGACLAREYDDNEESKMMSPNKVGEYLAKGLYLLSVDIEYMRPFKAKGIASLAAKPTTENVSIAMKEALQAIDNKAYKENIKQYVHDFFCMQQQLKPITNFIKQKG